MSRLFGFGSVQRERKRGRKTEREREPTSISMYDLAFVVLALQLGGDVGKWRFYEIMQTLCRWKGKRNCC